MARNFFRGLLNRWQIFLFPIALILWLLWMRKKRLTVQVPERFRRALQQALSKTKYKDLTEYWLAVAKMETDDFSSGLYLNANNPWGMKIPKKRLTTAVGSATGQAGRDNTPWYQSFSIPYILKDQITNRLEFARYPTLQAAADDIVLYMNAVEFPARVDSLAQFVQAMKERNYFGEEDVKSYLDKIIAQLNR